MTELACPRCGAVGDEPCVTPSGAFARRRHVDRPSRQLGHLETLAAESIDAAQWITDADALAVGIVLGLARQMDDAATDAGAQLDLLDEMTPSSARALTPRDKAFTWVASVIVQYLDRLGLTNQGRRQLQIEIEDDDDDRLAAAIKLHG